MVVFYFPKTRLLTTMFTVVIFVFFIKKHKFHLVPVPIRVPIIVYGVRLFVKRTTKLMFV